MSRISLLRPIVLAVSAVVLFLLASASLARAAETVYVPNFGHIAEGEVQPNEWSAGSVGASFRTGPLSWTNYGEPTAVAIGSALLNDCDPDCAGGTVFEYPTSLTFQRIMRCASPYGFALYYTQTTIVVTYPEDNPFEEPEGPSEPWVLDVDDCARASYVISADASTVSVGPFRTGDGSEWDGDRLENLFGRPTTSQGNNYSCTKRWKNFGMIVVTSFQGGYDETGPCVAGVFELAVLTSKRWRTQAGIRPGSPARVAKKFSRRTCTKMLCRGRKGYVLALQKRDCGQHLRAAIIAQVSGKRVKQLVVQSTLGC